MKYNFSRRTQDDVFDISNNLMVMLLICIVVTVSFFPEIALATVDDSASTSDGLKYIPKLIQDTMNTGGGKALMATGAGVLAVGGMAFTGITVPKAVGAGAVGAAVGYGMPAILGISGAAIF